MWVLEVEFEDEEVTTIRGEESDIPLMTAIRWYNMFVKEANGRATYRQTQQAVPISLTDKIMQLVGRHP